MKQVLMVAAAMLTTSAANAQGVTVYGDAEAPSTVVSFADLNIASLSGQDRLKGRIRAAARSLCLDNSVEPLAMVSARRTCFNSALASGHRQMNHAMAAIEAGTPLATATLIVRGE